MSAVNFLWVLLSLCMISANGTQNPTGNRQLEQHNSTECPFNEGIHNSPCVFEDCIYEPDSAACELAVIKYCNSTNNDLACYGWIPAPSTMAPSPVPTVAPTLKPTSIVLQAGSSTTLQLRLANVLLCTLAGVYLAHV